MNTMVFALAFFAPNLFLEQVDRFRILQSLPHKDIVYIAKKLKDFPGKVKEGFLHVTVRSRDKL